MYKYIVRPILFLLGPETVHHLVFEILHAGSYMPGFRSLMRLLYNFQNPRLERRILGLTFKNPVGLAAGFDKDARAINELSDFGYGFIEIGTLTPRPQPGNDKPRLFRVKSDRALINRMGFNNQGVDDAVKRLKNLKPNVIVGGNIGKNKATPNEQAVEDYAYCFEALHPYVDYFVVNVSSPNTPGLRELQEREPLTRLLSAVKTLSHSKQDRKPVLLKIAPDLSWDQIDEIILILKETGTDGIIATNTTISREGLKTSQSKLGHIGAGGLSGAPLADRSTEIIAYLRNKLGPDYPIIGVGGIMSPIDAVQKLKAGANLVQIYTGFVYEGPGFIKRINKAILDY